MGDRASNSVAAGSVAAAKASAGAGGDGSNGNNGSRPSEAEVTAFDDMPLGMGLLRGIYSTGFERPSAIQQLAIVPMARGGDVLAQAPSGTGKTGAFSIGLLQRIDARRSEPQALVLSPTRELAEQTHGVLLSLGAHVLQGDHQCQLLVGGTAVKANLDALRAGCVVAVGTPGRVVDLVGRGALRVGALRTIVLDEADEMLSQGFAEQVTKLFSFLPRDVQVGLFSATMPPEVVELTQRFMRTPTRILVPPEQLTLKGIKQFYVALNEEDKIAALEDLYETVSVAQSVVFANRRDKVTWVAQQLGAHHHTVAALHADVPKVARARVMGEFRSGSARVLVTSDLVARGIDVQHVNIVINYDLPDDVECYLHRIGRGGRFGRKGLAINFVAPRDVPMLRRIEQHYGVTIAELPEDFVTCLAED